MIMAIVRPLFEIYRYAVITTSYLTFAVSVPLIYLRLIFRTFYPKTPKIVEGEVVLITGAGNGIGRELALQLSDLGCVVVAVDIDEATAAATAREIRKKGGVAISYSCDVSNKDEVYNLAGQVVEEVGDVNILINNAGVRRVRPFLSHTDHQVEKIINTNLYGQIWMLRAFLPRIRVMKTGTIVSMSAVNGYVGFPNMLPFVASKFAVRGLMEGLYIELRQREPNHSIHLMTVAPFIVDTGMVQGSVIRFPGLINIVKAKQAAVQIVDNMRREEAVVFIPRIYYYIMNFIRILPLKVQLLITDFIDMGIEVGYDFRND